MEEITLEKMNLRDRSKLKKKILKMKKNPQIQSILLYNEQKMQNLQSKINKVKEKKEKCMLEVKTRVIKEKEYENKMHYYDLQEYEYEIEILLLEKDNFISNSLMNRLYCLYLILSFIDGVEVLVVKDLNGQKKQLYIQDVYQMFFDSIIGDTITFLKLELKIAQMYMIMNTNSFMTKDNNYFLEEEKQKEAYAFILELHDKIKQIHNDSDKEVFLKELFISDFFNEDILSVYERFFDKTLERKITKYQE